MFEPVWRTRRVLFFSFGQLSEVTSFHCARKIQSQEYFKIIQTVFLFDVWCSCVQVQYTVCSKQYLRTDSVLFDCPDWLLHSNR